MSRSEDAFDFSDQMFAPTEEDKPKFEEPPAPKEETSNLLQQEVKTSYLLVNVLLNLLVRKGIIHNHEVQTLLAELHQDYQQRRKGQNGNGDK